MTQKKSAIADEIRLFTWRYLLGGAKQRRIDAMSELGKSYKSFAGIKEGMEGSTKFIIETKGVE